MTDSRDLEIIELRGKVDDLTARCEALEMQNLAKGNSKRLELAASNFNEKTKAPHTANLVKAAWFPIVAALIRLAYKVIYRVKK